MFKRPRESASRVVHIVDKQNTSSTMSTVNIVKFYFHARHIPGSEARMRQLIALAYQTARDKQLYPKAVFIRYVVMSIPNTGILPNCGTSLSTQWPER